MAYLYIQVEFVDPIIYEGMMDIHLFLTLLSGICWTLVYLEGIRLGLRDHSYAIPFWALALNLAWELLYGLEGYKGYGWEPQTIINLIWFLLDCGILYSYIIFGRKYFPAKQLPKYSFHIWTLIGLSTSIILQWLFFKEFGFGPGAKYSAFLQNLLMSILFISMLLYRRSSEGQSLFIALNKWIGTLAPTIHLGIVDHGPVAFILTIGALISIFDLLYIWLLLRQQKFEK